MYILVGLIWVLISRMPSLVNLSPLYRLRSRNVISSVENSAVKLMRGCRHWCSWWTVLGSLLYQSKLKIYHLCISSNVRGRGLFLKGFWIPVCPWKCWHRQVPSLYPWLCPVSGCKTYHFFVPWMFPRYIPIFQRKMAFTLRFKQSKTGRTRTLHVLQPVGW